jgi:Asp-tRNA(Asn)/Glu-tRNA(Gln) amidotransferase A subunit family amidase
MHKLGLREIVAGVCEKRFTESAVLGALAKRIDQLEARVQAWAHLDLERAMHRAEDADAKSGKVGILQGAPLGVKDIIDVAGMPTRFGSPIYDRAAPALESAECVAALERAGANILGKTVTTEFAYFTPRQTRNPWNPSHTPGGSSMGSAAAVACGMIAGALGTQTNGSVVRPAAFCGVVGYKPSYGTVSNHGTLDPWPSLDHTGVFARHVKDAALLASVIAAPGAVDAAIVMPARTPKLALVRTPVWHLATSAQRDMLASNAATLSHAGAAVSDADLPAVFDDAHRVHRTIMAYEGARYFRELQRTERHLISPRLNELLDEGAAIAESEYEEARTRTSALREAFSAFIAAYDAVITPPTAGEAPPSLEETGNPAFCTMWTLLGVPAITIPVGVGPSGLPLGLQIVGAALADDRLLGIAAWCEAHLPFRGLP